MKQTSLSGFLLGSFFFVFITGAFLTNSPALATDADTYRIVIIPKIMGIQYYDAVKRGIDDADQELTDVEVIWIGPSQDKVEQQIEIIEQIIPSKPDLIAVAANHPQLIEVVLDQAAATGIRFMSWDADCAKREFFVNLVDYNAFGSRLATSLHRQVGDSGDIAMITTTFTAVNQVRWMQAIKRTIFKQYPGLNILDIRPATESTEQAYRITRDYIVNFPTLKGIIALGAPNLPGAAKAVKEAGLSKKIALVGNSTPNLMRPYLKEGVVQEVFLWNAPDHGYLTVYSAYRLLTGAVTPGAPFDAGRLGAVTPVADDVNMQVSLPILTFTSENVDDYDF